MIIRSPILTIFLKANHKTTIVIPEATASGNAHSKRPAHAVISNKLGAKRSRPVRIRFDCTISTRAASIRGRKTNPIGCEGELRVYRSNWRYGAKAYNSEP